MSKQSDIVKVSQGAAGDPLFVDSTNNRVGIGTDAPNKLLHLKANTPVINLHSDNASSAQISFTNSGGVSEQGFIKYEHSGDYSGSMQFRVSGSERLRIDSSGKLLVGKTADDVTVVGTQINNDGFIGVTRNGNIPALFNRTTSDGDIVSFRKDGTTVGTIGVGGSSAQPIIGSANTGSGGTAAGLRFDRANNAIEPWNVVTNASADNIIDLGFSSIRFDDVYATNGTIQTSDRNEKQDIAELTVAEITAAKAISKLFKTFKWNSSVAEKGEAARIHSGVIAQDVEQAMTDAGLDAGRYAFFISSTWWELDGQTYENAEEAPEGAVEKNRKGIRYPQLLSFVGAATEQRLASIESRLDALEDN